MKQMKEKVEDLTSQLRDKENENETVKKSFEGK